MFVCGFIDQKNLSFLKEELKERMSLVPDCSLLADSELEVEKGLLYMFSFDLSRELCFRVKLKAPNVSKPIVESVDLTCLDQIADWGLNNRADGTQHCYSLFKENPDAAQNKEEVEPFRQDGERISPGLLQSVKKSRFFDDQTEEFLRKSKRHAEDRLKELDRETSLRRSSVCRSEICLTQYSELKQEKFLLSSPINPNMATSQMINKFEEAEASGFDTQIPAVVEVDFG